MCATAIDERLMKYFLPARGCVKYLVSDELEHCAQCPQRLGSQETVLDSYLVSE